MKAFLTTLSMACCTLLLAPGTSHSKAPKGAAALKTKTSSTRLIQVLQRGKAPYKKMHYTLAPVQRLHMSVRTKMTMRVSMQVGAQTRQAPPVPTPAMHIETTLQTKGTRADGYTHIIGQISNIKILPSINTPAMTVIQLRKALAKLKGAKVQYVFTRTGLLKKGGFQAPKGINQQMRQILNNIRQNMQQIIIPFPSTAIGVGAKWRAVIPIQRPLKLTQTMEYTLQKIVKGQLHIHVTMRQVARNQHIRSRSAYGIIHNHIHLMKTVSKGKSILGLKKFYLRTQMKGHSTIRISVKVGKKQQKLLFRMKMNNQILTK